MKIQTDDGTLEVDAEQVELEDDDPFLSQDEVDSIVSKRVSRAERTTRNELLEDDEFFQTAAEERGIEIRDDGRPKGSLRDEELKELKKKASKVESLSEKVSEYEEQIEETRRTRLENKVLTHADGIADGAEEDVLTNIQKRMTYDDDYGWAKAGEDGLEYQAGEPVGVESVVEEVRKDKPFLFQDRSASDGPKDEPSSSGSGKKTWSESEHANADPVSMDQETYEDWASAAEENRIK